MYHEIVSSGATGGTQRNLADFTADMNAIKARVDTNSLDCVTFNEWVNNTGLASSASAGYVGLIKYGLTGG